MEHQDIVIEGTGVGDHHCYIENINGVITLHPIAAMCAIDGKMVIQPTRLAQGKLVFESLRNLYNSVITHSQ